MNCKQGDIAVIVRASRSPQHLGKIVTVARVGVDLDGCSGYFTKEKLFRADGSEIYGWKTAALRPIRPSEGQDETLSWKDVPQGEIA